MSKVKEDTSAAEGGPEAIHHWQSPSLPPDCHKASFLQAGHCPGGHLHSLLHWQKPRKVGVVASIISWRKSTQTDHLVFPHLERNRTKTWTQLCLASKARLFSPLLVTQDSVCLMGYGYDNKAISHNSSLDVLSYWSLRKSISTPTPSAFPCRDCFLKEPVLSAAGDIWFD